MIGSDLSRQRQMFYCFCFIWFGWEWVSECTATSGGQRRGKGKSQNTTSPFNGIISRCERRCLTRTVLDVTMSNTSPSETQGVTRAPEFQIPPAATFHRRPADSRRLFFFFCCFNCSKNQNLWICSQRVNPLLLSMLSVSFHRLHTHTHTHTHSTDTVLGGQVPLETELEGEHFLLFVLFSPPQQTTTSCATRGARTPCPRRCRGTSNMAGRRGNVNSPARPRHMFVYRDYRRRHWGSKMHVYGWRFAARGECHRQKSKHIITHWITLFLELWHRVGCKMHLA